ncbi:MAG: hypothetical protein LBL67_01770 [Coriobacteriales bacterium]|jgi:hypothetical protein|nr:hypothetical protein [Coriobacteriales bacterium]
MSRLRHISKLIRRPRLGRALVSLVLALVLAAMLLLSGHSWRQTPSEASMTEVRGALKVSQVSPDFGPKAGGNQVDLLGHGMPVGYPAVTPGASTDDYVRDADGDGVDDLVAMYDAIDNTGAGDAAHSTTTATWANLANNDIEDADGKAYTNPYKGSAGDATLCDTMVPFKDASNNNVTWTGGVWDGAWTQNSLDLLGDAVPNPSSWAHKAEWVSTPIDASVTGPLNTILNRNVSLEACFQKTADKGAYQDLFNNFQSGGTGLEIDGYGSSTAFTSNYSADCASYLASGATDGYKSITVQGIVSGVPHSFSGAYSCPDTTASGNFYVDGNNIAGAADTITGPMKLPDKGVTFAIGGDVAHGWGGSQSSTPGADLGSYINGYPACGLAYNVRIYSRPITQAQARHNALIDDLRFGFPAVRVGGRASDDTSGALVTGVKVDDTDQLSFKAPSLDEANTGGMDYRVGEAVPVYLNYNGSGWVQVGSYVYGSVITGGIGFSYASALPGFAVSTTSDGSGNNAINEDTSKDVATIAQSGDYDITTADSWSGADGSGSAAAKAQHSLVIAAGKKVTLNVIGDLKMAQGAGSGLPAITLGAGASLALSIRPSIKVVASGATVSSTSESSPPGIAVPRGASLTVTGSGTLVASGGAIPVAYTSAGSHPSGGSATGAGIGSAGQDSNGVGSITIKSSAKVYASGGALAKVASGGSLGSGSGAGIGSGGNSAAYAGDITISGKGQVVAEGGESCCRAGAGIGCGGGFVADSSDSHDFSLAISTSGKVVARGGLCDTQGAAGIGGGGIYGGGGLSLSLPQITISDGQVLARASAYGGSDQGYGGAAGIGCGSIGDHGSGTASGLSLTISGGEVVAEASVGANSGGSSAAKGIGDAYDGVTTTGTITASGSVTISGGSVWALNPAAPFSPNSISPLPTADGSQDVYPVYVGKTLNFAGGSSQSTDGVSFGCGSYRGTARDWLAAGDLGLDDASGTSVGTFDAVPIAQGTVSGPVSAVLWLPQGTVDNNLQAISASGLAGQEDASTGLYANVAASFSPVDHCASLGATVDSSSYNWVYFASANPALPDDEGFIIKPYDGVSGATAGSGSGATGVLKIAPTCDTSYTIYTDKAWSGTLPQHCLNIAPAAGIRVHLRVIVDPADSTNSSLAMAPYAESALPGIQIAAGAKLSLEVEDGASLSATGAATASKATTAPGIAVPKGSDLAISGSGSLSATGGANTSAAQFFASGAGIGSAAADSAGVGTIELSGQVKVTAKGGAQTQSSTSSSASPGQGSSGSTNYGAGSGAGIGSGGNSTGYAGDLTISDGASLFAQGGAGMEDAGAGIGSGGYTTGSDTHCVSVSIDTTGSVVALGGDASAYEGGAGIGLGGEHVTSQNCPEFRLVAGTVIAKGGASGAGYGAPAGIGACGSSKTAQPAANLQVTISGGTLVAQAGACTADSQGLAKGVGTGFDGQSSAAVALDAASSAVSITSGNVYAVNPNPSQLALDSIAPAPTDGSQDVYPVYIPTQMYTDPAHLDSAHTASTDGVHFTDNIYSGTAHAFISAGSFSPVVGPTVTFKALSHANGSVWDFNACFYLPWEFAHPFHADGAFAQVSTMAVSCSPSALEQQGGSDLSSDATYGSGSLPGIKSIDIFYVGTVYDFEGFEINQDNSSVSTPFLTADDASNTLTFAPTYGDAIYTIRTDPSWDGSADSDGTVNHLPDHALIFDPGKGQTSTSTITLAVFGDVNCLPTSTAAPGIWVKSGTLKIEVESGLLLQAVGSYDSTTSPKIGYAGIAVASGAHLIIDGPGSVYAQGAALAADIGGNSNGYGGSADWQSGDISVEQGTVVAYYCGSDLRSGACFGSGAQTGGLSLAPSGSLTVDGGSVIAYIDKYGPSANIATASLIIDGGSLLCASGGAGSSGTTRPWLTLGTSTTDPPTNGAAYGSKALYPVYVEQDLATSGTLSVPDGLAQGVAYQAPLTDLGQTLRAGGPLAGRLYGTLPTVSAADSLAACIWLPGSAFNIATSASGYQTFGGISLSDAAGQATRSDLLANVDAKLCAYGPESTNGTALADGTNLVQPSEITISGARPMLGLDVEPEDLETANLVSADNQTEVMTNLDTGYQTAVSMSPATTTTALVGASGQSAQIPGITADGLLGLSAGDDSRWAYLLQDGLQDPPGDNSVWWAPKLYGKGQDSEHVLVTPRICLGNDDSPTGLVDFYFGLRANQEQAPGTYVGTVLLTVSSSL